MRASAVLICALFLLPNIVEAQFYPTEQNSTPTVAELPQTVDLIIESDTAVPTFYQGRREPSAGSVVRAIAVVPDTAIDSTYRYTWRVGTQVLGSTDQVVRFPTPLDDPFLLRVDVFDAANTKIAATQRYVSLSEPSLLFYEDSLLRGMSESALPDNYLLVGDEVSVRAEPYFTNSTYGTDSYDIIWRVNNREVAGGGDPHVITLRRNEGHGSYSIDAMLRNLGTFNSDLKGGFSITF